MRKLLYLPLLLLAATWAPLGAQERVMVGDDIFVGPDEDLSEVVCIGCSVYVEGEADEVVSIAGSIVIGENAEVGEVVSIAGSLVVDGQAEDVVVIAGSSEISGVVDGDLVSIVSPATLVEGASIDGNAVVVLGKLERAEGVSIGGELHQQGGRFAEGVGAIAVSGILVVALLGLVLMFAIWPIVSFICFAVMGPERAGVLAATVSERAGMCFLIGVATWISSIIISIMLPIFFFWIPGGMESIVSLAFMVTAAVGYTGVSFWVGRSMIKGGSGAGATVLGSIIVTIIQAIPVLGWFIAFPIFGFIALGAAVVSGFGTSSDWLFPRAARDIIARPVA